MIKIFIFVTEGSCHIQEKLFVLSGWQKLFKISYFLYFPYFSKQEYFTLVVNTKYPATEQLKDPFCKGSNLFLLNCWLWFKSIFLKLWKIQYSKSREESEMLNKYIKYSCKNVKVLFLCLFLSHDQTMYIILSFNFKVRKI